MEKDTPINKKVALAEIEKWVKNVSSPRKELSGFPICPYAKMAIREKKYQIIFNEGGDFYDFVENEMREWDDEKTEIKLLVSFIPISYRELKKYCETMSKGELKGRDFFMIPEHPDRPIQIGGVSTRLNKYPMIFLQRRSRLNGAAQALMKGKYYEHWDPELFQEIVGDRLV